MTGEFYDRHCYEELRNENLKSKRYYYYSLLHSSTHCASVLPDLCMGIITRYFVLELTAICQLFVVVLAPEHSRFILLQLALTRKTTTLYSRIITCTGPITITATVNPVVKIPAVCC